MLSIGFELVLPSTREFEIPTVVTSVTAPMSPAITPPPTRNLRRLPRKSLKVQSYLSDSDELEGPPLKRARIRRDKPSSARISSDEDVAQLANEVDEDRMLILSLYITLHYLCILRHRNLGFKVKNPSQNCVSGKFRKTKKYSDTTSRLMVINQWHRTQTQT